jgi:hypothetical protein
MASQTNPLQNLLAAAEAADQALRGAWERLLDAQILGQAIKNAGSQEAQAVIEALHDIADATQRVQARLKAEAEAVIQEIANGA